MESQANASAGTRKLLYLAPITGIAAAILNTVLFLIGSSMGAVPPAVRIPDAYGQPLTLLPVLISSVMPALVAGLVLFLLIRFTKKPLRIFNSIAAVILLLSFASPFTIPNITTGMIVLLELMHVVVAASVVYMFNRYVWTR